MGLRQPVRTGPAFDISDPAHLPPLTPANASASHSGRLAGRFAVVATFGILRDLPSRPVRFSTCPFWAGCFSRARCTVALPTPILLAMVSSDTPGLAAIAFAAATLALTGM